MDEGHMSCWLTQDRLRLQAFREGSRAMLASVYTEYAPPLLRRLLAGFPIESGGGTLVFLGRQSSFESEDVLQETFVRAFSDRARLAYDGVRPFAAWLAGIAHNLLVDRHRSTARREGLFVAGVEALADERPSPEALAADGELAAAFAGFVDTLEKDERVLLQLRLGERATRRAVSEKTGWSAMQVRSREKKVFDRLLSHMRRFGIEARRTGSGSDGSL